jgi:hypothetical protein
VLVWIGHGLGSCPFCDQSRSKVFPCYRSICQWWRLALKNCLAAGSSFFKLIASFAGIQIDIKEGDLLYLPAGWWHQVSSHEGQHIAINYWWRPPGWQGLFSIEQQMLADVLLNLKKEQASGSVTGVEGATHTEL